MRHTLILGLFTLSFLLIYSPNQIVSLLVLRIKNLKSFTIWHLKIGKKNKLCLSYIISWKFFLPREGEKVSKLSVKFWQTSFRGSTFFFSVVTCTQKYEPCFKVNSYTKQTIMLGSLKQRLRMKFQLPNIHREVSLYCRDMKFIKSR